MILSDFVAELHCQHGQVGVATTTFGDNPIKSAGEDGWLCTKAARPDEARFDPVAFHFQFLEQKGDRIHYNISCAEGWAYKGALLAQNSDGWVGLYGTHVVGRIVDALSPASLFNGVFNSSFWKIDTHGEWDGTVEGAEKVSFYLRDTEGYIVHQARSQYSGYYVRARASGGDHLTFNLRNIQLA